MTGEVVTGDAGTTPPARRLRIALSANRLPADPDRVFYPPSDLGYVEEQMGGWVASTGAIAYVVPPPNPQAAVGPEVYAADCDGLVLTGGADVSPTTYGQEPIESRWAGDAVRDRYEIDLLEAFLAVGKPVLGICRGQQLLNVAFGGTLWQDLVAQGATSLEHRDQLEYHRKLHEVDIVAGGWLAGLHGESRILVNTIHHQAVRDLGRDVVAEAHSTEDRIIEAIRVDRPGVWARGVQWHPEFFASLPDAGLADTAPLLADFLAEVERVRSGADVDRRVEDESTTGGWAEGGWADDSGSTGSAGEPQAAPGTSPAGEGDVPAGAV